MMKESLKISLQRLHDVTAFKYFKQRSMPDFVEPVVRSLVDDLLAGQECDRSEFYSILQSKACVAFGWYARRLAGQAVRDHSVQDLVRGLTALAIETSKGDWRDSMGNLALFYNSALHLKVDPKSLFEEVAKVSTPEVAKILISFLDRSPEQKSIGLFRYAEGTGPLGFDYIPLQPEFGGPTPFDRN